MQAITLSVHMDKVYDVVEVVCIFASVILLYWGLLSFNVKKTIIGVLGFITVFGIAGWAATQNVELVEGIVSFLCRAGYLSLIVVLAFCLFGVFYYCCKSEAKRKRFVLISGYIMAMSHLNIIVFSVFDLIQNK